MDDRYNSAYLDNSLIEKDITYQIFERNRKLIVDQVSEMSDMMCSFSRVKMWQIKQKVCTKIEPVYPVAKINQNGDLVSNRTELKTLYSETYKDRLRHRTIKPIYSKPKELKEKGTGESLMS